MPYSPYCDIVVVIVIILGMVVKFPQQQQQHTLYYQNRIETENRPIVHLNFMENVEEMMW